MQTTETQLNQMKLLKEYVAALERRIAATHKELVEEGKMGSLGEKKAQHTEGQQRGSRSENQRPNEESMRLIEVNMKVEGLERQLGNLMGALRKEQADKEQLLARVEQMAIGNHNLYHFHQQLDAQHQKQARVLQFYVVESEEKSKTIQLLQTQIEQSQRDKNILKQQFLKKQIDSTSYKEKVENLQADQQETSLAYKGEINRLKDLLGKKEINYKRLQESHSMPEKASNTQHQDVLALKGACEELVLRAGQLQQEKKVLQDKRSALQSALLSSQTNLQHFTALSTNLSQQNQKWQTQVHKIQAQLQKQKYSSSLLTKQLSQAKQRHEANVQEITDDFDLKIKQKDASILSALRQIEELKAIIRKSQLQILQIQSQKKRADFCLNQQINQLQIRRELPLQYSNNFSMQPSFEKHSRQSMSIQQQSLKYMITILKDCLAEQKRNQQSLLQTLQANERKLIILEQSNTTLRQMVITSKIHQEASMKELQSLKTRTNIHSNPSHTSLEPKTFLIIPRQRKTTRILLSKSTPQTSRDLFHHETDCPDQFRTVQEQVVEVIGSKSTKAALGRLTASQRKPSFRD